MLNSIPKILCSLVLLLRRSIVAGKGLWKVETIKLKIWVILVMKYYNCTVTLYSLWFSHGMTKGIKLSSHSWLEGLLRSTTLSSWGCCFLNCPFGMGEGVGRSRVWSVSMQKNCTCDSPPKNRIPTFYWSNLDRSSDAHEWVTPYDKPLILNMQTSCYKKSFVLASFIRLSVWRTKSHKL